MHLDDHPRPTPRITLNQALILDPPLLNTGPNVSGKQKLAFCTAENPNDHPIVAFFPLINKIPFFYRPLQNFALRISHELKFAI
jgi:hypothetical protein